MALGIGEWVVIVSGLVLIFTAAFMKDAKMKKYLAVGGVAGAFFGLSAFGAFGLLTWLALIIFLVLGSIYFWKEINKKR